MKSCYIIITDSINLIIKLRFVDKIDEQNKL